jgi:hypothetical protein
MSFPRLPISLPMCLPNLAPLLRRSSATMDESLTTLVPARSSSPTVFTYACPAPIPRPKTVRLSASFVPLTMLFAAFCFRRPFHPPSGLRHCRQPPTYSTFCQPRRLNHPLRTMPFLGLHLPMTIFASSVVNAILTCLPQPPTNYLLGPPCVSFWDTLLIIRDTAALTSLLID